MGEAKVVTSTVAGMVEPAPRVPCPHCRQPNHARVQEQKPDGHFAPGPMLRCVNCKEVFRDPAAPITPSSDDPTGWSKISRAAREACGLEQEQLADIYNNWVGHPSV